MHSVRLFCKVYNQNERKCIYLHHCTAFIFGLSYSTVSPNKIFVGLYITAIGGFLSYICICMLLMLASLCSFQRQHQQQKQQQAHMHPPFGVVCQKFKFRFADRKRFRINQKWFGKMCALLYALYFQITLAHTHNYRVWFRFDALQNLCKWIMNVSLNMHWFFGCCRLRYSTSSCQNVWSNWHK